MISVIAPVYNVNKYIDVFLTSFLPFKKGDIELIIIDDRGLEDPKPIIDKYKDRLNIKLIINEKNLGLGFSRNEGLKHISKDSTHIMYIDSDDKVYDDSFINEIKLDKITWFNNMTFTKTKERYENKIGAFGKNLFTNTIWGVAIPVSIAKKYKFEHRNFEDLLVNRRIIKNCSDDIILSKTPAVAYRYRGSGINSSKPTVEKFNDFVDGVTKLIDEDINTRRFNIQEIYQYYNMWKPYLKEFDKSLLPKTNIFYKSIFSLFGKLIRWLHIEGLVYGRNKKDSFD